MEEYQISKQAWHYNTKEMDILEDQQTDGQTRFRSRNGPVGPNHVDDGYDDGNYYRNLRCSRLYSDRKHISVVSRGFLSPSTKKIRDFCCKIDHDRFLQGFPNLSYINIFSFGCICPLFNENPSIKLTNSHIALFEMCFKAL